MCSTLNYSGAQRSNAGRYYADHYRNAVPPNASSLSGSNTGRFYANNDKPSNKAMPVALALGIPTDMQMVASVKGTVRWPEEGDEYAAVGAFRGEPVPVVESETIPGLMVPAHAEWIIEGEFLPELGDEMLPRYAKDIASGYLSGKVACPILRVNCITHRKNPWWTDTTFSSSFSLSSAPGARSHEGPHTGLQFLAGEAEAINHLRGLGFMVKDVVMVGGGREVAVVQMGVDGADKPYPHYGKQALMALHGSPGNAIGIPTKYLIAVGPDINPYDFQDVMWALGTRTQPVSDTIVIGEGLAQWGDPDARPGPMGRKSYGQQVMIDALIKVPERHSEFPPRSEPGEWETQAINQMRERIEKGK
ncbi:MAG: UbiD family decarboxylase [Betaproteobacteria bacterium]|nr:UbiD family decarboxylase [Betaproteobacteria bacterium]